MSTSDRATEAWGRLLGSRKFWVLVLSVVPPTMLVILGELTPGEFVSAVGGLCGVFMAATAYEDGKRRDHSPPRFK